MKRLLAAAAVLCAADAFAHAELVGSSPTDGARLDSAPGSVELRFNEPVVPASVRLFRTSGAVVELAAPKTASEVLRVVLPAGLGEGHYALSFRVISLDSHPIGGAIAFTVGEASLGSSVIEERDELRGWRVAVRAARDFALLIAAGGALFVIFVARFPGQTSVLAGAALVALVAAVVSVGLQGAAMLGSEAALWMEAAWRTALHSSFGASSGAAILSGLLIAAGAWSARAPFLAGGAVAAIASFTLTGHAAGTRAGAVGQLALAAHVLAAAFWTGSLCGLLRLCASPVAATALRRFSRMGIVAVAVLVSAGIAFAVLQLHEVADLWTSPYGRLIIGKATLLAALFALASLNRFVFLPALERGESRAAVRLRRSIAGELALVACVVALTAILVQTPPPREPGFRQVLTAMERTALLTVSPARAGRNSVRVHFRDFEPAEVHLEMGNAGAGMEPVMRAMKRDTRGDYVWDGPELVVPGTWTVEVHARIGDFDRAVFRAEVSVR